MKEINSSVKYINKYISNGKVLVITDNESINLDISNDEYKLENNGKIYDEYEGLFFCGKESCKDSQLNKSFQLYKDKLNNNSIIIIRTQITNYDYENIRIGKFYKTNEINKIKSMEILREGEEFNILLSLGRLHFQLLSDGQDMESYGNNVMKSGCGGCSKNKKSCCSKGGDCGKGCCNKS